MTTDYAANATRNTSVVTTITILEVIFVGNETRYQGNGESVQADLDAFECLKV